MYCTRTHYDKRKMAITYQKAVLKRLNKVSKNANIGSSRAKESPACSSKRLSSHLAQLTLSEKFAFS